MGFARPIVDHFKMWFLEPSPFKRTSFPPAFLTTAFFLLWLFTLCFVMAGKPFPCGLCARSFATLKQLWPHQKESHTNQSHYKCPETISQLWEMVSGSSNRNWTRSECSPRKKGKEKAQEEVAASSFIWTLLLTFVVLLLLQRSVLQKASCSCVLSTSFFSVFRSKISRRYFREHRMFVISIL